VLVPASKVPAEEVVAGSIATACRVAAAPIRAPARTDTAIKFLTQVRCQSLPPDVRGFTSRQVVNEDRPSIVPCLRTQQTPARAGVVRAGVVPEFS
jgi:hypothetical protein